MHKDIRVVLIGDTGVGKSTLVTTLIKEMFFPNVQPVVPEVTIPPEVTPENVTTHIIDTSPRQEYRNQLDIEIRKAHVIGLVYAVTERSTFYRISEFWLPYLRSLGIKCPVILIGNQTDLRVTDMSASNLENDVVPIMNEYPEVESCVECSAKDPTTVSEVFYFAQKAVLHPTGPLYNSREHSLKSGCREALTRIFKLCDTNKDGVLDDEELNAFQSKCFHSPLHHKELAAVRAIVEECEPSGVTELGLTLEGFLYLHKLFIQRGRLETTWMVLRTFGYGDDLHLRPGYLLPTFDVPSDCTVELSPQGIQFLTQLFDRHDKDRDGALSPDELGEFFSTTPGNPWAESIRADTVCTTESGALPLQSFLAQWHKLTTLDPNTTLSYLVYLGFDDEDARHGLQVLKLKSPGGLLRSRSTRTVYRCLVVGAPGVGKTALLRAFIDKPFATNSPTQACSVVNAIQMRGGRRYLILEEPDPSDVLTLLRSRRRSGRYDALCLVYDSSDPHSFAYLVKLRETYDLNHLPVLIVATKGDRPTVEQTDAPLPPVDYCHNLGLSPPICTSVWETRLDNLYYRLLVAAMNPSSALPDGNNARLLHSPLVRRTFAWSLLLGVLAASGFLSYRFLRLYGIGFLNPSSSVRRDSL
ncbi:ERMES complex Ca(2+)-binding regulatory GTPase gem1 [Dispira simplex]|nr:ERMES complex Ca(2+)-binding regulatory GTPase gem1 [Dispira simplex]